MCTLNTQNSYEAFYSFCALDAEQRRKSLANRGILIDTDIEKDQIINLYFLQGFFVEEYCDKKSSNIELIPFKKGFRSDLIFSARGSAQKNLETQNKKILHLKQPVH